MLPFKVGSWHIGASICKSPMKVFTYNVIARCVTIGVPAHNSPLRQRCWACWLPTLWRGSWGRNHRRCTRCCHPPVTCKTHNMWDICACIMNMFVWRLCVCIPSYKSVQMMMISVSYIFHDKSYICWRMNWVRHERTNFTTHNTPDILWYFARAYSDTCVRTRACAF